MHDLGTVIPFAFLTKEQMFNIWKRAEDEVAAVAILHNVGGTKDLSIPAAKKTLNIRQAFIGVAGGEVEDLAVLTAVRAAQESWGQDAADLTVDVFSSILAAAETMAKNRALVVFGFIDLSSVPMLSALKFERGPDLLDLWEVEHCYGFPQEANGGLSESMLRWGPEEQIKFEANFKSGDFDQHVVLFTMIAETFGDTTSPPKA